MKKRKSMIMTLLAVVLSISMVISGMSFFAFAAPRAAVSAETLVSGITVQSKVKYGDSFDVPAGETGVTVSVKAPNGQTVKEAAGSVKAEQVGSYVVTYTKGDYSYDFNVYSYVDEEYEIKVDHNGADIPTFRKKGEKITLPKARLVWYDEDGIMHEENAEIKASVSGREDDIVVSGDASEESRTFTADTLGLMYIRYSAKLKEGLKFYSKDFTVRVQNTVNDNEAPKLTIVNVPTEASINRKVTLPTVTATDDLDENVKVVVTVKLGDELVKKAEIDANGYATGDPLSAVEEFDNDKLMSFYPRTLDAKYTVTYQAFDDNGRETAPHTYTITCVDKVAPVFTDIDESAIPEKWGLTVKSVEQNADGEYVQENDKNKEREVATGISFPKPDVVDNNGEEGLTVSFRITNSDNATVMSFDNILDESEEGKGRKFTSNGANYGEGEKVYEFGNFAFDFNEVQNTDPKTGTYTVEYRARDAKGNVATKTYRIEVETTYTDEKKPLAPEVELPSYLVFEEGESFVVPTPTVADAEAATTRLNVEYKLTSVGAVATEGYVTAKDVKGGEEAEFELKDGKKALVFEDGDKLLLTDSIQVTLKVTDSVGLFNVAKDLDAIKVITTESVNNPIEINASINSDNNGTPFTTKQTAEVGGFTIAVTKDNEPFTGFEVAVKNAKNEILNNVSLETYYDYYDGMAEGDAKIVVRNIKFTPSTAGTYKVEVRAFNLAGKSTVHVYPIVVEGSQSGGSGTENRAVSMPTSGSVYTAYKLQDKSFSDINDPDFDPATKAYYLIHKIAGARFSLMGDEFTAYSQGTYQFTAGYTVKTKGTDGEVAKFENIRNTYSISTTDTDKPVIEVLGLMPTYAPKKGEKDDATKNVTLPSVAAVGRYSNATIDIKITDKTGKDVKAIELGNNSYAFEPLVDGAYTVVYTAALNGSEPVSATFTINVGDVVAPDFTVASAPSEKVKLNAEFKFSAVTATVDEGESLSDYTFTKKLIDPAKAEVVSISGTGSTYANRTDNGSTIKLDKSGSYTVIYEVSDKAGNKNTIQYTIVVSAANSGSNISLTMISTILIIVGVLLIAGVIIYFVRYRKVKPNKEKK